MFVVGLAPNNIRTECLPCQQAQLMNENDEAEWQIIRVEQGEEEQLISFDRPQTQCSPLPSYESSPANVSFHTQTQPCQYEDEDDEDEDPYASCDMQFQQREKQDKKYIIYRVQ